MLRCGTSQSLFPAATLSLLIVIIFCAAHAYAQEAASVQTTLIAETLHATDTRDGRRLQRFVPATVLTQGQVVFYTVQVRNPTSVPVRDVLVVQRIPDNTTYVGGTASGPSAEITFSVDGGQSFWPEKELVVTKPPADARKATTADYTHIRWQLRNALAPGAVALARFQAVFR